MSSFNTSSFPGHLALAKDDVLTIGRIDEVQKLHVRTVPLGEQPFRICHCPSARALVVVTMLGPGSSPTCICLLPCGGKASSHDPAESVTKCWNRMLTSPSNPACM